MTSRELFDTDRQTDRETQKQRETESVRRRRSWCWRVDHTDKVSHGDWWESTCRDIDELRQRSRRSDADRHHVQHSGALEPHSLTLVALRTADTRHRPPCQLSVCQSTHDDHTQVSSPSPRTWHSSCTRHVHTHIARCHLPWRHSSLGNRTVLVVKYLRGLRVRCTNKRAQTSNKAD